jgi:signal transduction histidine kinase
MVSPIVLVQSVDAEPAMLICVPIYRPEVPLDTVEARRANLTGFVSAVHLIRPLFTASLAETNADMDFHLFERSQTGEVTWYHTITSSNSANDTTIAPEPAPTLASLETGLNGIAPIKFAEHQWLVVAKPGATLTRDKRTLGPWAVMLLIITLGIVSSSVLLERISARRDIMLERRKSEEAFLEARAANDSKTFFMAAAGHDIKQPLYALGIMTDTLLMSDPKPSSVPLLEHLRKSIDAMGEQFDDLMSAGKLNHGNFEPILKKVHLAGIIAPVDAEITLLCADKGLRWNLELENAIVITDPLLLQRLLRNLLSNAVRYTNDGEVSCRAIARGKFVEFRISDTGRGIALSNQKEMFDEFVLRDDYPYDSTGTGLGLTIVAKINQALDLGLQIFSAPGEGTTFSFEVPLVPKE